MISPNIPKECERPEVIDVDHVISGWRVREAVDETTYRFPIVSRSFPDRFPIVSLWFLSPYASTSLILNFGLARFADVICLLLKLWVIALELLDCRG